MRLDELRDLIMAHAAAPSEWHRLLSGPYFTDAPDIDEDTFEQHSGLAVLKPNIDVTVQWGLPARGYYEPTLKGFWGDDAFFPDDSVYVYWVDVFWKGTLVDRETLVSVDGGRAWIPRGWRDATEHHDGGEEPRYTFTYGYTSWQAALADVVQGDAVEDWRNFAERVEMREGERPR